MQEAIRRDYADRNPLVSARIRREQPKAKPYLSPTEISLIREHLKKKPLWMQTVLEICAHIGCRFNESSFSKNQVDFDKDLIWMTDSKRDETDPRKTYAVPLPESLKAYLQKLFEQQDFTVKPLSGEQNRLFNKELKKVCPGATSHSLRLSFITRCHIAGISEHQAMRLVNHSNSLVHQIYSKLNIEDVRAAAKLVAPPLPAA
jgi:site-specific recombinase XerD